MTRKNWWKYLCLMAVTLLLSGCSLLDNLLFAKTSVPEFSFSGYVFADGKALDGATVDCGVASTETNESGYFKFTGINKVVQVTTSKDGYLFGSDLVFVSSISSDVNFRGYKLFDKSGVVRNNNVVVSGVDILAESENGEFETKSNEYGEFYLPNLAGQVKVTAKKDGFNFFTQSFTIDKEDKVVISGITDIDGKINVDSVDAEPDDFVLKVNGIKTKINDDFTFVASSVEPGSIITCESTKYHIDNSSKVINSELQQIIFDCEKYYSVSGTVYCGNTQILDATIKCGNLEMKSVDGTFHFDGLYGKKTITASVDNYSVSSIEVSADKNNPKMIATTKVSGKVVMDIGQNAEDIAISYNGKNISCDNLGRFTLTGVQFGDKLNVSSDVYYVPNEITIEDRTNIVINASKYYTLNVSVASEDENLANVELNILGRTYSTDADGNVAINGLYGANEFQLSLNGYKFDSSYSCDYFNNTLNIDAYEIYSVSGNVKSGEMIVNNATITINGKDINVDNLGAFEITEIYGNPVVVVSAENYNSQTITLSKDNRNIVVNLSYNVSGIITCGKNPVNDVVVIAGNQTIKSTSDGTFSLTNLYGATSITYSKAWYAFPSSQVSESSHLNIQTSYSLKGNVSKKGEDQEMEILSNFKILLVDKNTNITKVTYTNDLGDYQFVGLTGEYALVYDMDSTLPLKPSHYDITTGGNYDFSNNGYSFGGVVTCGNTPLADVVVSIGNAQTTTDKDGVYSFGLVTKSGILTLEKLGYSFQPINHNGRIDDSYDEMNNVNYSATYCVSGKVISGSTPISGVNITIADKTAITDVNGKYYIDGLFDTNEVTLSLNNYKFSGATLVSGYVINDYIATFDVVATIKSGDIYVSGATLYVNNVAQNVITSEMGVAAIINLSLGDTVSFVLDGFDIQHKLVDEYIDTMDLTATYNVTGVVSNCGIPLVNVKVAISEDKFVYTNESGAFVLENIIGTQEITFTSTGYNFDNVVVNGAKTLNVMSKFDVEGTVKIGGKLALEGVKVTAGNHTTTTDKFGKFKIIGLTTATLFIFEKDGYDFGDSIEVSTPNPLNISATYKIIGKVKSGDTIISGASISTATGISGESDDEGKFILSGIDSATTITIIMDGYNQKIMNVEGYNSMLVANLDYDVVLNFSGLGSASDYTGISIKINNSKVETCNESIHTIRGLKGETLIKLAKDNCHFEPTNENNEFVVTRSETKNITIVKLYSITGTVKTANGLPVAFATVYAGKESTVCDIDGNYSFTGLSGTPKLKAVMPYYNPTSEQEEAGVIVKEEGNYNITIANDKFVLNFLNYAYDNLRHASSYQIFGGGDVVADAPVVGKQTQSVSLVYKKDSLGNKIFENKNKGGEIMGIDPNVALLSYFYTEGGVRKVKYQQIFGSGNFSGNYANYSNSWDGTNDASWYKENYGVDADGFSPYTIKKSTIASVSSLSLSGDTYSFTITLSPTADSYSYYAKLMSKMCSAQTLKGFSSITLSYTITRNGLLRTMKIVEKYTVNKGVDVPVEATINYKFVINSLTEIISNIDTTSPATVLGSIKLGEETPVESTSLNNQNSNNICPAVDVISYRKEELL